MKKMQFTIEIQAPSKRVWSVLWDDKTFRDWASNIDEGIYLAGEMKEGNEMQFISGSGYGVTSLIDKLIPNEFVLFRHMADTQDRGKKKRDKEWTGGEESYSLAEKGNITTLTVHIDLPPEQEENFKTIMPKALQRVKALAERSD